MEITKRLPKTRLWFGNSRVLKWLRHPHTQPCLALYVVISLHQGLLVTQKTRKPEKIWQLPTGGLGENHAYSERCVCGCILSRTLKSYYNSSRTCAVQKPLGFIHSFDKYLLTTYFVADSTLRYSGYINKWSRPSPGKRQWTVSLYSMLRSTK